MDFREKTQRLNHIELEMWLNQSIKERARKSQKGEEERVKIYLELLEKISKNDPNFGVFIRKALDDIKMEEKHPCKEYETFQRLVNQEKTLEELKLETERIRKENKKINKQLLDIKKHIERRRCDVDELETTIRQRSSIFQKQCDLNSQMNNMFKLIGEHSTDIDEIDSSDPPQIVSLRNQNCNLREKIRSLQTCITYAEEEIAAIKSTK